MINKGVILHRILMPTLLVVSALIRPCAISLVYLILYFVLPFTPTPYLTIAGSTKALYIVTIAISIILFIIHISIQALSFFSDGFSSDSLCLFSDVLMRHIGFIKLDNFKNYLVILEWLAPEIIMFLGSISVFFVLKKIINDNKDEITAESGRMHALVEEGIMSDIKKTRKHKFRRSQIGAFVCLVMLFLTSAMRPSAIGGFYFLIFLLSGTYWACYKTLERGFGIIMKFILILLAVHICIFVTYQTPWAQTYLGNSTLLVRLSGLEPLYLGSCENDIRNITLNTNYGWDSFLFPFVMLLAYYTIATNFPILMKTQLMRRTKKKTSRELGGAESSHHELSSNIGGEGQSSEIEEIKEEIEVTSSIWNNIQDCFGSLVELACEHSYLFTSITMMTWSIIYHSWLTFVFLIWANILWMIPNQRQAMLRSSPLIVFYAEFLLLATYLYGMNLNEDELPSHVDTPGISLEQIGFERLKAPVCVPLIVKVIFTCIFWVTLRQLCKESQQKKIHSTSLSEEFDSEAGRQTSIFLKNIGRSAKNILVKSWIWLLIVVIFLCAISGKKMTGFRIFYMALFLFFLLAFQISWIGWMKVMFGYWVFLIIYAMFTLVLIYTYQFQNFPMYWEQYLGIPVQLQNDIGLETFEVKGLFLHLLAPTFIVIMTAIQVHYIHKEFIASLRRSITSRSLHSNIHNVSDEEEDITPSKNVSWGYKIKKLWISLKEFFADSIELMWIMFEVHLVKIIFIVAFVCCVKSVSVLHLTFVVFCVVAVNSREQFQVFFSRVIAIIMAILILAKMIYQIEYIFHENYKVLCEISLPTNTSTIYSPNETNVLIMENNAEWFGFSKTGESGSLFSILNVYVVFMIVVTLHEISTFRKAYINLNNEIEYKRPIVVFPGIGRKDAEEDFKGLLKYLCNFGFYKFGLEITLTALAACISYHQDLPAVLYCFWLCLFVILNRATCAKLWTPFVIFTSAIILLQYIVFIGVPPGLCYKFPWNSIRYLEEWAVLPGPMKVQNYTKLLFDFILLMCICRQKKVFLIEESLRKNSNIEYEGGSNESIINNITNLKKNETFVNPTVNFMALLRNWSDVVKVFIFNGIFWIALMMVFLCATYITSIFSVGYLMGTFIFLWQGTDFYLRPLKQIISWWSYVLYYNVIVITIHTILQIGGCLFYDVLQNNTCWLIHLFKIGCINKKVNESLFLTSNSCPPVYDEEGVSWDVVCFVFLLAQLRIFNSYYFCHIVNEAKASAMLAERGADLIEDLRLKEIRYKENQEQRVLRKIKKKMEKIRATQQRALGTSDKTHYDEYALPVDIRGKRPPKGHGAAIRAGDYYMFDDVDEKFELDLFEEEEDYLEATGKIDTSEKKLKDRKTVYEGESEKPTTESTDVTVAKSKPEGDKDEIDSPVEEEKPPNAFIRIIEAILVACAVRLNQYSRHYRYVMKILSKEKKTLMENSEFSNNQNPNEIKKWTPFKFLRKQHSLSTIDGRPSSSSSSHDTPTTSRAVRHSITQSDIRNNETEPDTSTKINNTDIKTLDTDQKDLQRGDLESEEATSRKIDEDDFEDYEEDFVSKEHYLFVELLIALWYSILANTDFVCYFIIFINQISSASLLSLPLPFMVFMWGTLSLPRPTKTFWVTLIAYTLTVVLIKCVFQFKTIWHEYLTLPNQPLSGAAIIGIEPKPHYAALDLILLLALFFHRFVLKSQGLWKSSYMSDEISGGIYILKNKLPGQVDPARIKKSDEDVHETSVIESDDKILVLRKKGVTDPVEPEQIHVHVTTITDDPQRYQIPSVVKMTSAKYCSSIIEFFKGLLHATRLPCDVYAFMFLCDFINFFVLLLGFTAFGSAEHGDGGGVSTYLADNKVPIPFLIMLLIQFFLIIADRAIYLRKSLLHKIIYHYFTIVGIHIWMFFVVPAVTERKFNALAPPVIFYLIKCFYFLLSSYQIRCGYPKRILGNFLCKGFTLVNSISFKVYMAIPFLFELRTFLDWVCTESTFTVFDWLKMENIYSEIFLLKCARQMEKDFPVPRATKKPMISKIIVGGIAVVAIVVLIWAPLTLFALNSAVGYANVPFRVTALLQIGPYEPIYEVRTASIKSFTRVDMLQLQKAFKNDKNALTFITSYDEDDIASISLQTSAPEQWRISPPNRDLLIADLKEYKDIPFHFSYTISRSPPNKQASETLSGETKYLITHKVDKDGLLEMLNGVQNNKVITLERVLPKFIKMKNSGEMSIITQLTPPGEEYRNISLKLFMDENNPDKVWWEIREICNEDYHKTILKLIPGNRMCDRNITILTFNDKKFPETFSFLTAGGIIGMYTTFILVAARVLRSSFITGASRNIMFEDLPYVDRVLQLCLDIYLVREALEFALEEDLFAKLIFLYRSPETMIKWTRPKEQDHNDTDNDTASVQSRSSRRR